MTDTRQSQQTTNAIEKQIFLRAPRARVWRALTDAREFGTWFGVSLDDPIEAGKWVSGRITHPGYEHVRFQMLVERMRRSCRTPLNSPSVISDDVWTGIVPPQIVKDCGGVGRPAITMYPVDGSRIEKPALTAVRKTFGRSSGPFRKSRFTGGTSTTAVGGWSQAVTATVSSARATA